MQQLRNLSNYVNEFPVAELSISDAYDHEPLPGEEEAESSRGNEQEARAEHEILFQRRRETAKQLRMRLTSHCNLSPTL
jgi:hypothetical protein